MYRRMMRVTRYYRVDRRQTNTEPSTILRISENTKSCRAPIDTRANQFFPHPRFFRGKERIYHSSHDWLRAQSFHSSRKRFGANSA